MIQRSSDPVDVVEVATGFFERRMARLLIAMYYGGERTSTLLEGETRQIDSLAHVQQFDFWLREPGHLALALIQARMASPDGFASHDTTLRAALAYMLHDDRVDTHRIESAWKSVADWDESLSFLTSRALVSDRPSFMRTRSHQIILEAEGVRLVREILTTCPSFDWYRAQAETIAALWTVLAGCDLITMPYLAPDLTPATSTSVPLVPIIRARMTF